MKFGSKSILFCVVLICAFLLQACVHLFHFNRYEIKIINLDNVEYFATKHSLSNGNLSGERKEVIASNSVCRYKFSCCNGTFLGINGHLLPRSPRALISPLRQEFLCGKSESSNKRIKTMIYFDDYYPNCEAVMAFIYERRLYMIPNELVDDCGKRYHIFSFIRDNDTDIMSWVVKNKEILMESQPSNGSVCLPMFISNDGT